MRDPAAFDSLLTRSFEHHARRVDRPFDPHAIAREAALADKTVAGQAFAVLSLRTRLLLVALVALAAVALAAAGARLLEPKPLGWGTTLYLLTDVQPGGGTVGGPFLVSVPLATEDVPTLRVALDAAGRGLPADLQLKSVSSSGRFALLSNEFGLPLEEPGFRVVVDTADGSVDVLPPSFGAAWSPTGDLLSWWEGTSDAPFATTLAVLDADSGRRWQVLAGAGEVGVVGAGGVVGVLWSSEAALVVDVWQRVPCVGLLLGCLANGDGTFERAESTTWLVPVDGGPATEIERPGSIAGWRGPATDVSVSPDRTLVGYFVEDWGQLEPPAFPRSTTITVWVHGADGSNGRALATFTHPIEGPYGGAEFTQTVWSADSGTFSWAMLDRLWVARVDGSESAEFDLSAVRARAGLGAPASMTWYLP